MSFQTRITRHQFLKSGGTAIAGAFFGQRLLAAGAPADAQREAAESYIASQKAEGWTALADRYDDGGYCTSIAILKRSSVVMSASSSQVFQACWPRLGSRIVLSIRMVLLPRSRWMVRCPASPSNSIRVMRMVVLLGAHRLVSEHLTAEYRVKTQGRGRELDEWKLRTPGTDNHWLDCLVGCAVAGSMQGAILFGTDTKREARRPRLRLSDLQGRRR